MKFASSRIRSASAGSPGEFHDRWLGDDDAALGRALSVTRHVVCPAVEENYSFLHPNPDLRGRVEGPYDGVRELWWPSVADLERAADREPGAWAQLVRPSAADVERSFPLLVRERIILA